MSGLSFITSSVGCLLFFFFQAEDGIRYLTVTGVQTCALPISCAAASRPSRRTPRTTPRSDAHSRPREPAIESILFETHKWVGFVAVVANAIAGVVCLVAWRVARWRGRWVWILTIVAEVLFLFRSEEHTSELQSQSNIVC